jgi:hypothetical protein
MKQIISIVEVSEISIDLDNPIRPTENNSDNIKHRNTQDKNGRFFIQAITLCNAEDTLRPIAVTDRY